MLTTICDQTIQWLGIRFVVPGEWQVVRHSPTPQRGGLVLVDRYRQRMQLNWTTLPGEPDLARMIEDYRAKQLEAQPGAQLDDLERPAGWVGVKRTFGGAGADAGSDPDAAVAVTRAVRYDEPTRRVLEVILNTGPDEDALIEEVLASIEAIEPLDAVTRLRVFDIDVTTPVDWRLAKAEVKPADVALRYTHVDAKDRETRQELIVRRMGMADTWWHGDAERFIRRTSPRVRFTIDERTYGGRTVTRGVGTEPGPRGKRMLGFLRRREDLLWHDAAANAVFHVVVLSWAKRNVTPDLFQVTNAQITNAGGADAGSGRPRSTGHGGDRTDAPELAALLAAVPVANRAVRQQRHGKTLTLYVPIRQRWWMGPPFRWVPGVNFRKEQGVALDALGFEVWQSINGRRTVEEIVERFAQKHRLRFHEARISVMTFLKMLMQRNLVAVVGGVKDPSELRRDES